MLIWLLLLVLLFVLIPLLTPTLMLFKLQYDVVAFKLQYDVVDVADVAADDVVDISCVLVCCCGGISSRSCSCCAFVSVVGVVTIGETFSVSAVGADAGATFGYGIAATAAGMGADAAAGTTCTFVGITFPFGVPICE